MPVWGWPMDVIRDPFVTWTLPTGVEAPPNPLRPIHSPLTGSSDIARWFSSWVGVMDCDVGPVVGTM